MAMSFAVRRPTPADARRQRFNADSDSDEEREGTSQAIDSFDGTRRSSAQGRGSSSSRNTGGSQQQQDGRPLVIPSQKNKDWKKEAEKLRAMKRGGGQQRFRPGMGGDEGSGPRKQYTEAELDAATRITSNVQGGLAVGSKRSIPAAVEPGDKTPLGPGATHNSPPPPSPPPTDTTLAEPETADQKALKALLKSASGHADEDEDRVEIEAIHGDTQNNFWDRHNNDDQPLGDEDLFRADVLGRPDSATMDDYQRVPVEAFGAALLRGMYASGDASSSKQQKPIEPYIPKARPNLLGIGAKELDLGEDKNSRSAKEKERQRKKESMHFVPLIKKEKPRSGTAALDDLPMLPPSDIPSRSSKDKERRKEERSGSSGSSSRKYRDEEQPRSSGSSSRRDRDRDSDYDDDDRYYSSKSSRRGDRDRDDRDDDRYHRSSASSSSSSRRRSRSPPPSDSRRDRDRTREKDGHRDSSGRERERDRDRDCRRKRDY